MTSSVTLTAKGLNTSSNQLSLEDGTLSSATNVIIRRDNVIEPRRGYKLWAEPLGTSTNRAKQLLEYKNRILRHFNDTIQFQDGLNNDGSVNFTSFAGNYLEVEAGLRIKSIEANSNLYFTTADGIKKISAKSANDLTGSSGSVANSGAPKGLDSQAILDITLGSSSGFLPQDASTAYRVVWGYRDLNENLVLGAPSGRAEVYNPMLPLMLNDFNRILAGLDQLGSDPAYLINDDDYLNSLGVNASFTAQQLKTNALDLATKIDLDIVYTDYVVTAASRTANVVSVNFNNTAINRFIVGNSVTLAGFSPIAGTSINGTHTVTAVVGVNIQFANVGANGTITTGFGKVSNITQQTAPVVLNVKTVSAPSNGLVKIEFDSVTNLSDYFEVAQTIDLQNFGNLSGLNLSVLSTTRSGNTVTVTFTATQPTNVATLGDFVSLTGFGSIAATAINGTYQLTSVSPNTLSFVNSGADGSGVTFGDIYNNTKQSSIVGTPSPVVINGSRVVSAVDNPTKTLTLVIADVFTGSSTVTLGRITDGEYRKIVSPIDISALPTHDQLTSIQDYLNEILDYLKSENSILINPASKTKYIASIDMTISSNVNLIITIPEEITTEYFYQVYRSEVIEAVGTDVLAILGPPSDELQQVFEGFVAQYEIDEGVVEFTDITPDAFLGANLYTNANSGEGILQSNNQPPLATDLNLFKGYLFFSNTKTRHNMSLDLLGVSKVKGGAVASINNSNPATVTTTATHSLVSGDTVYVQGTMSDSVNGYHIVTVTGTSTFTIPVQGNNSVAEGSWSAANLTITNGSGQSNIYSFVEAAASVVDIGMANKISYTNGEEVKFNSANNERKYVMWFKTGAFPFPPSYVGVTSIEIDIQAVTTAAEIAVLVEQALSSYSYDFTVTIPVPGTVRIQNTSAGFTDLVRTDGFMSPMTLTFLSYGIGEQLQKLRQIIDPVADVAGSLAGKGFLLYSPFNKKTFYVWFRVAGSGVNPDPVGYEEIQINIPINATVTQIVDAIAQTLDDGYSEYFNLSSNASQVIIENDGFGDADFIKDIPAASTGFTYVVNKLGILTVEKSAEVSPSIATAESALSLISAINKNKTELVYAYYLSGVEDVAGKMLFESRSLSVTETPFYVIAGDLEFGSTFNPDISSEVSISAISVASPTVITSNNHGYTNGQQIVITGSNSLPSIDGVWTVSNVTANTFTVPKEVFSAGTTGFIVLEQNAIFSDNESRPNRVYYSKFQQPEAVPLLNYIDIGAKDKQILRIYPLRDSLFIFKEDGLYRVSGETAPFSVSLFDGSCILLAPDSLAILENIVYGWARSGIVQVTESGVQTISRPIDNIVLPTSSNVYPGFKTATFGIGYESDQSYTVWTVQRKTDTVAKIAYRYNLLTRTFTTYDKTDTCGIINSTDDLMYLGAGDTNYLEQERKNFERTDYADREVLLNLNPENYINKTIVVSSVDNILPGDVYLQTQLLTIYTYNMLLRKIDLDTGPLDSNFYETLKAIPGVSLRNKIIALAQKLDLDPNVNDTTYESTIASKSGTVNNVTGVTETSPVVITSTAHGLVTGREIVVSSSNTTPTLNGVHIVSVINANEFSIPVALTEVGTSGTFGWSTIDNSFNDINACYNTIISKLNSDSGVSFSNYMPSEVETVLETIIVSINRTTRVITIKQNLDFVTGPVTVFNSIKTTFQYSPITMQDPLGWKHLREATIMFESRAFTAASLSFATDILPELIEVPFDSDGNGSLGSENFGEGYFGGASNAMPFRTYVPRQCQRCRFIVIKYAHAVARESYQIFGVTITGNIGQSERAYRK